MLLLHILSEHEESPHDGAVPTCSKSPTLATHFCKTCEENLCKFDIIKHYKYKIFNKDHEMIPIKWQNFKLFNALFVLIHFDINVSM